MSYDRAYKQTLIHVLTYTYKDTQLITPTQFNNLFKINFINFI